MRRIEITPSDVVLFRDGRPFGYAAAAGASVGVFPPFPSTVFGALRTAAYRAHGVTLRMQGAPVFPDPECKQVWGDAATNGSVRLRGLALWHGASALWPSPGCVVVPKTKAVSVARRAAPAAALPWCASGFDKRLLPVWLPGAGTWRAGGGYYQTAALETVLGATTGDLPLPEAQENFVVDEPREGIAIDDERRTTREGALFQMGFRRLVDDTRFVAWIDADEGRPFPENGMLRLGQDGKVASFRAEPGGAGDWPRPPRPASSKFLIYLATPARFKGGWLPSWVDPADLRVRHRGWEARLVAASLERPQNIGGWDLARGGPRALHAAVRAGAVYFFEAASSDAASKAVQDLHGSCLSEAPTDGDPFMSPAAGWGLSFTGVW